MSQEANEARKIYEKIIKAVGKEELTKGYITNNIIMNNIFVPNIEGHDD